MQSVTLIDPEHAMGICSLIPLPILAPEQSYDVPRSVTLEVHETEPGTLWARARITNTGTQPLRLTGIRWVCDPSETNGPALHFPSKLQPMVYANENLRSDYFGTGTVEGNCFALPLTNQFVEYGNAEEHLFPGLFITTSQVPVGLFIAQASQQKFHAIFRFRGRMERRENWLLEIEELTNGISCIEVMPGESIYGEKILFHLASTNDPQRATDSYFRLLRHDGAFARQEFNPLSTQRIYCTWNYDFFADITQEKILGQLPILNKHFSNVKFIQLDDGYQTCHSPGQRAMIDLCYGDLPEPFDRTRFPDGPRGLVDRIKAAGYRSAIWLGLWASTGSRMLKDHPDWILHDDTGTPMVFNQWYGGTAVLDPSIPQVRDYFDHLCHIVFQDWGFEGVKLDFSSFAFNGKRVRYRHPGKSGVELRHELESIFRKHLPRDGFFGWCVVAGTSQPFLSQADYFRNAIDIGHGDWPTAKRIAKWTANTNMFLQQRPCLPNLDSIGWSNKFDETMWQTWLKFCAIAGGALEVSGDLRKLPIHRLEKLSRTLALSDPDRCVRCLDLPSSASELPPSLWLSESKHGHRMLGLFNWGEIETNIALNTSMIKPLLISGAYDAWTGEALQPNHSLRLAAHDSVLWDLSSQPSAKYQAQSNHTTCVT